jgi:hypothetical protein
MDVVCQNVSILFSENAKLLFLSLLDIFQCIEPNSLKKAFLCIKEMVHCWTLLL